MSKKEVNFSEAQLLRTRAEEQLTEKQKKSRMPEAETDIKKLLHELQVHQIELEMQNEELRQANATTETALKKYTLLYDLAPIGFFTIESDGSITELNFTAAKILGERRFSLVDRNLKFFIAADSVHIFNDFFNEVYTSNRKVSCEISIDNGNNHLSFVYMEGITTGENKSCLLSMIDITNFKNR